MTMNQESRIPVNVTSLLVRVWMRWPIVVIGLCLGLIGGILLIKGTPKEYTARMSMVPEEAKSSGASELMSLMGVSRIENGNDAYTPPIYPEIVASLPFIVELLEVELQLQGNDTTFTLRQYIEEKLREPWWSKYKIQLFPPDETEYSDAVKGPEEPIDPFHLTRAEAAVVSIVRNRVTSIYDTKTATIIINVELQDPLAAAQLTDTVAARLQEYITDYRTAKARHDLDYAVTLNEEAKVRYYEAQQNFAEFQDTNHGLVTYAATTKRDRLQNEMQLAFNLYNSTSQKVQQCLARVQASTPIFAVVEPSTVPLLPSSPKKFLILAGCGMAGMLLGAFISVFPFMMGNDLKKTFHEIQQEDNSSGEPPRRRRRHKRMRKLKNLILRRADEEEEDLIVEVSQPEVNDNPEEYNIDGDSAPAPESQEEAPSNPEAPAESGENGNDDKKET